MCAWCLYIVSQRSLVAWRTMLLPVCLLCCVIKYSEMFTCSHLVCEMWMSTKARDCVWNKGCGAFYFQSATWDKEMLLTWFDSAIFCKTRQRKKLVRRILLLYSSCVLCFNQSPEFIQFYLFFQVSIPEEPNRMAVWFLRW